MGFLVSPSSRKKTTCFHKFCTWLPVHSYYQNPGGGRLHKYNLGRDVLLKLFYKQFKKNEIHISKFHIVFQNCEVSKQISEILMSDWWNWASFNFVPILEKFENTTYVYTSFWLTGSLLYWKADFVTHFSSMSLDRPLN